MYQIMVPRPQFCLVFAFVWSFFAVHVRAQTQMELNDDACIQYSQVDKQMNQLYRSILSANAYATNKEFLVAFKKAQKQWLKSRDAELEANYPGKEEDKAVLWGSVYPMCRCEFLRELTVARIEYLKRWMTGIQEGEVCGGAVRVVPHP